MEASCFFALKQFDGFLFPYNKFKSLDVQVLHHQVEVLLSSIILHSYQVCSWNSRKAGALLVT
jgi:hypothetical protein